MDAKIAPQGVTIASEFAHIAIKREFGDEERGAELGNEFLGRIGRLPKPPL